MSEQNTTDQGTNVTDSKPAKAKRANTRNDFTKLIAQHARKRNIDTTRAGKELRAKARREFDKLCKLDSALAKAKSSANDGNRWPALNDAASKHLLTNGKKS
jgi:hypothetical protein